MNILISSTRQWNPGDEFIRKGVKRLIDRVLGPGHNWLLWDRNPDRFLKRWEDPRPRSDFLNNSLREPALDLVDLVIFAGTPEWFGPPVSRIFRELLRYPDVPVMVLGAGSSSPDFRLDDHEVEVLQRDNVLLTTRSQELAIQLNMILKTSKALPLPCPAFFCTDQVVQAPTEARIGLIVQSSAVENQSIPEELVQSILGSLNARPLPCQVEVICFYIDEFMRFARLGHGRPCHYSYEPDDLLKLLARYSAVLSTRLHGAIAGLSCQLPSVLLSDDQAFRLQSTRHQFGHLLPRLSVSQALEQAALWTGGEWLRRHQEIQMFKNEMLETYTQVIANFLSKRSSLKKCA